MVCWHRTPRFVFRRENNVADVWIKVRTCIAQQREIRIIARSLGLSIPNAVGLCVVFWAWCDSNTADGYIRGLGAADVDDIAGARGFAQAMIDAGWLECQDGLLLVPHFTDHNGSSSKQRALAALRMAEKRTKGGA